jgi:hypothetical protein
MRACDLLTPSLGLVVKSVTRVRRQGAPLRVSAARWLGRLV